MFRFKTLVLRIALAFLIIIAIITVVGHLLRSVFPKKYDNLVDKYCDMYDVNEELVYSLIKAESNFDQYAQSSASAKGLMQLKDETFLYCLQKMNSPYERPDIFDPDQNINAGVWYLSFLIDRYNGNTENAIAAYNAGISNVDKWLNSEEHSLDGKKLNKIPFWETSRHTKKINKYKKIYSLIY